jgi:hypothetical protein
MITGLFCGERGIRTPGPVTVNGFQDRRIRPLCHFSSIITIICLIADANIATFSVSANTILPKLIFFFVVIYNTFKTLTLAKINILHIR